MHRWTRRVAILATTTVVATLFTAGAGSAAVRQLPKPADVPGTALIQTTIQTRDGSSQAWLFKVDLTNKRLHIRPVLDWNVLNSEHETVPSMARRTHAIAGINGDFWNWSMDTAGPLHGLTIDGHLLKTPGTDRSANFYTTTDGHAHIGLVTQQVLLSRRNANNQLVQSAVFSLNNYDDILRRHLVLTDNDMATVWVPRCSVAYLAQVRTGWQVTRTAVRVTHLERQAIGHRALVLCARQALPVTTGQLVHFPQTSSVSNLSSLLSGGAQLIRRGVAYRDPKAQLPTTDLNPMTFGCVDRSGSHVTFGVVDGRRRTSVGITPAQLTRYLLHLGCWNAMSFDGGGSSTMYARNAVQNRPSDGQPRQVADGLFVFRS